MDRKRLDLGGTAVEAIPVAGGETRDGVLYHFVDDQLLFGGDFIMPYLGAPHAEEGSPVGLLEALDVVAKLSPARVLHGHEGINRLFPEVTSLLSVRKPLTFLRTETERLLAAERCSSSYSTRPLQRASSSASASSCPKCTCLQCRVSPHGGWEPYVSRLS